MKLDKLTDLPLNRDNFDDYVTCVAFSPDGTQLASVTRFSLVQLWDLKSGKEKNRFQGTSESWKIIFSSDGGHLAVASDSGVFLWNINNSKSQFFNHAGKSIAFHPLQNIMASFSGGDGGFVDIRNLDTNSDVKAIGHTYAVNKLAFNFDGSILGTISDKNLYLWWGDHLAKISQPASDFAFFAEKDVLVSCYENNVYMWDIESPNFYSPIQIRHKLSSYYVYDLKVIPRRNFLAWNTNNHNLNVNIWNISSDELFQKSFGFEMRFGMNFIFSPDGKTMAICGESQQGKRLAGDIQIWELID